MRLPRPFYSDLGIVKNFNIVHAEIYNSLKNKLKIKKAFLGAFKCGVG